MTKRSRNRRKERRAEKQQFKPITESIMQPMMKYIQEMDIAYLKLQRQLEIKP